MKFITFFIIFLFATNISAISEADIIAYNHSESNVVFWYVCSNGEEVMLKKATIESNSSLKIENHTEKELYFAVGEISQNINSSVNWILPYQSENIAYLITQVSEAQQSEINLSELKSVNFSDFYSVSNMSQHLNYQHNTNWQSVFTIQNGWKTQINNEKINIIDIENGDINFKSLSKSQKKKIKLDEMDENLVPQLSEHHQYGYKLDNSKYLFDVKVKLSVDGGDINAHITFLVYYYKKPSEPIVWDEWDKVIYTGSENIARILSVDTSLAKGFDIKGHIDANTFTCEFGPVKSVTVDIWGKRLKQTVALENIKFREIEVLIVD